MLENQALVAFRRAQVLGNEALVVVGGVKMLGNEALVACGIKKTASHLAVSVGVPSLPRTDFSIRNRHQIRQLCRLCIWCRNTLNSIP